MCFQKRFLVTFLVFIFTLLLGSNFLQATINGIIKGKVIAEDTKSPLKGVTVRVFLEENSLPIDEVETDENGNFLFIDMEPAIYIITFESPFEYGYISLPPLDSVNMRFIFGSNSKDIYKDYNLRFVLSDGEEKQIYIALKKGVKVTIHTRLLNNILGFQLAPPITDEAWYPSIEIYSTKYPEFDTPVMIKEFKRVLERGEEIILEGNIDKNIDDIGFMKIKRKEIIQDRDTQMIYLDFDLSNKLEITIIPNADMKGITKTDIIEYSNNKSIFDFKGYRYTIYGVVPGKYIIRSRSDYKIDISQKKIIYKSKKEKIVEIQKGSNAIKIEF